MIDYLKKAGLIAVLTVIVFMLVSYFFKPFYLVNYIGPTASVVASFVLLWGTRSLLLSVPVVSLVTCVISIIFDFPIGLPFILIAVLGITLQSYWVAQITSDEVSHEKWLSKRTDLLSFLIKIGPVASLVSASAVSVLSVIEYQSFDFSLLFTFVSHWAVSILFSVFVVTLMLFSRSQVNISKTKRLQLIAASIVGLLALCQLFKATQDSFQHRHQDEFHAAEHEIVDSIKKRVEDIETQILALNALFNTDSTITAEEFTRYSEHFFKENEQVKFFGWAPVVDTHQLIPFINEVSAETGLTDISVSTLSEVSESNTSSHVLLQYLYPQVADNHYYALDLRSHSESQRAMLKASELSKITATMPITASIQGLENATIFVFYPIPVNKQVISFTSAEANTPNAATNNRSVSGYLVIAIDAFELFNPKSIDVELSKQVSLFIEDVTLQRHQVLYGSKPELNGRLAHIRTFQSFDRKWRVTLTELEPWLVQERSWTNWSVIIGGTLGGFLYQFLMLLMIAYSAELRNQITLKTRELILEKENSESASEAKSQFLGMLSNELQVPVKSLSGYAEQYRQQTDTEAHADFTNKVFSVAMQLSQFVRTIQDMSELETGHLVLQSQSFNLYEFVERIESMSNAGEHHSTKEVTFVVHKDVPEMVDGDELRIQQIFNALIQNGALIFNSDRLRISVKSHLHKHSSVTIFLVVTPFDYVPEEQTLYDELDEVQFMKLNTSMTLAQEICHQLGGSIKLSPVTEGDYMISASFKADISQKEEQYLDGESLNKYQQV